VGTGFSDKIMLNQKAKATSDFELFRFSFTAAHCGAECAAHRAAVDRRVRHRWVNNGA
jgi:hypothetical protein